MEREVCRRGYFAEALGSQKKPSIICLLSVPPDTCNSTMHRAISADSIPQTDLLIRATKTFQTRHESSAWWLNFLLSPEERHFLVILDCKQKAHYFGPTVDSSQAKLLITAVSQETSFQRLQGEVGMGGLMLKDLSHRNRWCY